MDTYLSLSSVIRGGCHTPVSPLFPSHTRTCKGGTPQGSIGGQKKVWGGVSRSGVVRRQGSLGGRLILIMRGAPQASIGVQKKVGGGMSRTGCDRLPPPVFSVYRLLCLPVCFPLDILYTYVCIYKSTHYTHAHTHTFSFYFSLSFVNV